MGIAVSLLVSVGVRNVSCHINVPPLSLRLLLCNLYGNSHCLSVERFKQVLLTNDSHFLAMAVVGESESNITACTKKVPCDLLENFWMFQCNLGYELAGS